MKLELEPTPTIQNVDGVPHRIWTGKTDKGVPVKVGIRYVQPQTHDAAQLADFEAELQELPQPRQGAIDIRFLQ